MPSKEIYQSLTMEIRPRIRSVNISLILFKPDTVTVHLNANNFEIEIGLEKETIQCEDFHINPNSLTCFTRTDNQVTFRFATEDSQQCYELLENEMKSCTITNKSTNIFLQEDTDYSITCKQCSQLLCRNNFKRVLPLPESLDFSDWFCHSHDHKFSLTPKENELFYLHSFAYLNPEVLKGLVRENSVLKCEKCISWIGTVEKEVFKIWFNTVVFTCSGAKHVSSPLSDCMKMVLNESNMPVCTTRFVLKCRDNPKNEYLLLWVLEPKLRIHFLGGSGQFKGNVAKVLFKSESVESDLVCQWISDLNVTVFDVSQPMIIELQEHLNEMSCYIPKNFNTSNGFSVSYIKLSIEVKNT